MIFRTHVTMDSSRTVPEMLKVLAGLVGEREHYATRFVATPERRGGTAQSGPTVSMIKTVLAERTFPVVTRLELDDIFTGALEVS